MDRNKVIQIKDVFTEEEVAASGSALSAVIDLSLSAGQFSLQVAATGSGTAQIDWVGSNDGETYIKPNNASDIVTAHTVTSGPGSDGKHIYGFNVSLVRFLKIRITETGGANSVTITATLACQ